MGSILIVEDDAGLRDLIGEICREIEPAVAFASSGRAALEHVAAHSPALVLLDYSLPDMNGNEVVEALKKQPHVPPFVVMTGVGSERIAVDMMKQGARDYLVKDTQFLQTLPVVLGRVLRELETEERLQETTHALLESAREWQATFDSVKSAIWLMDKDMRIVRGNRATEAVFGQKLEAVVGRHCWEVVHGTTAPIDDCPVLRARKNLCREDMELRVGDRWLEITADPVLDASGVLTGLVHSVADITERKKADTALRESDARYRSLFEHSAIPVWEEDFSRVRAHFEYLKSHGVTDFRAYFRTHEAEVRKCAELVRILDVNAQSLKFFKVSSKEEIVRNLSLYFVDDSWVVFAEELIALAEGKSSFESEIAIQDLKHRRRTLLIRLSVPPDACKTLARVLVSFVDITERKRAEEARLQSERRFRELAELLPLALYETDEKGKLVYVNRKAYEYFGYTEADFRAGLNVASMLAPVDRERAGARIGQIMGGEILSEAEYTLKRKDGSTFPAIIFTSTIRHENRITGLRGVIVDIAERQKAQKALAESETRFKLLFHEMMDGFALHQIICDGDGKPVDYRFLAVNPSFERLTGMKALNLIGKTVREVMPGIEQHWIDAYGRVALTGEPAHFTQYTNALGRHFEVTAYRPEPGQFACLFTDVTERRRMEEQLIQADKMVALGTLVAGVAHEINNPTNLIMLNSDVMIDVCGDMDPIMEDYFKENGDYTLGGMSYAEIRKELPLMLAGIREGAERIKRIVADLKRFARAEPPDLSEDVDVNEVVRSALVLLDSHVRKATQNLVVSLGADLMTVKGSFQRLEQVVVNLIQNACLALPDSQRAIRIETVCDGGFNIIRVTDAGVGMDEAVLGRLMEPFFTTRRERGGTGLGLSVSHGIIRDHGGEMRFESAPGTGTTVTVSLPVKKG